MNSSQGRLGSLVANSSVIKMFQHKAGNLKQQNKSHKTGKYQSRGQLKKQLKGKVEDASGPTRRAFIKEFGKGSSKTDRRNKNRQLTQQKRQAVLETRRLGTSNSAPKIVGLVCIGNNLEALNKTWDALVQNVEVVRTVNSNYVIARLPQFKQRVQLFKADLDFISILDVAKVSDILIPVFPCNPQATSGISNTNNHNSNNILVSELGEQIISMLRCQGFPSVIGALHGLEGVKQNHRQGVKKHYTKFFRSQFPEEPKLLTVDNPTDGSQIVRYIATTNVKVITWREKRPYMVVDSWKFEPNQNDADKGTFSCSGFLRGKALNVNNLVHITNFNQSFQLKQVDGVTDPFSSKPTPKGASETMDVETTENKEEDVQVLAVPNPERQDSLESENTPDPFSSEQTWPTQEELQEAEERMKLITQGKIVKKKVPKGTSEYQAAWIVDSDDEEQPDDESDEDEYAVEGNDNQHEEDMEPARDAEPGSDSEYEEIEMGGSSKPRKLIDDIDMTAEEIEEEERKREKQNQEDEEDDREFPDEVDTPTDQPARLRFQKYRGLKSFRTSPWDPKENLPQHYARIFQFMNFNKTKKRVMQEEVDDIVSGQYVTLHIKDVPKSLIETLDAKILIISGLLKYENKISVLNFSVVKHSFCTDPIRSKDRVMFHCGFRRYECFPIYSQSGVNMNKFKYERFLHDSRTSVATVYAPITFGPVPLLVTRVDSNQSMLDDNLSSKIVATGSLHSVNPDRIILKKIILTGYPAKIHKRSVVIREMFFNAEDIKWFRPVELWTKLGRTGHIMESLGTHGYMKCQFDQPLRQNDVVCLSLYKREFPVWAPERMEMQANKGTQSNSKLKISTLQNFQSGMNSNSDASSMRSKKSTSARPAVIQEQKKKAADTMDEDLNDIDQ